MASQRFTYKPIFAGFPWGLTLRANATPSLFPAGATFAAQVRSAPEDETVLATLTTENGGLTRVDDDAIAISISGDLSEDWPALPVYLDLVRTDGTDQHLGIRIQVEVQISTTRGAL